MTDDTDATDGTDDQAMDRADRVQSRRSRRQRGQTPQTEQDGQGMKEEQDEQDKQDEKGEQGEQEKLAPVTEREHDTYYLSKELRAELRRVGARFQLEYEAERDASLEKNRHIRPAMLYLGAQRLQEMSPDEFDELSQRVDVLDSTDEIGK